MRRKIHKNVAELKINAIPIEKEQIVTLIKFLTDNYEKEIHVKSNEWGKYMKFFVSEQELESEEDHKIRVIKEVEEIQREMKNRQEMYQLEIDDLLLEIN